MCRIPHPVSSEHLSLCLKKIWDIFSDKFFSNKENQHICAKLSYLLTWRSDREYTKMKISPTLLLLSSTTAGEWPKLAYKNRDLALKWQCKQFIKMPWNYEVTLLNQWELIVQVRKNNQNVETRGSNMFLVSKLKVRVKLNLRDLDPIF